MAASPLKQVVGTASALTVTGLSSLAAANYAVSASYSNANQQSDLIPELNVTASAATSGNQQAVLFAQASFDGGTTWQGGPTSGSSTTDEQNLTLVGYVPLKSTAPGPKAFSTAAAFGFLPPLVRYVVKNDCGVALSAGTLKVSELSYTVG